MSSESDAVKIDGGFVLVARAIATSSLITMPGDSVKVAVYLLAIARHKDYKWFDKFQNKDIIIGKGELTTTLSKIAEATNIRREVAKRALYRLLGHGFVEDITPEVVKSAHGYHHLKICKYAIYQNMKNYLAHPSTIDQTSNQQGIDNGSTLLKEGKHIKQNKSIRRKPKRALSKSEEVSQEVSVVWDYYCHQISARRKLSPKRIKRIEERLREGWTTAQLFQAIDGVLLSDYHMGRDEKTNRQHYSNIETIFRDYEQVEKFIELAENAEPVPQQPTTPAHISEQRGKDAMRIREAKKEGQ